MSNRPDEFWKWFDDQRRDLSIRQIEERSGYPRGRIGNRYAAKEPPTIATCEAIAAGLHIPKDEALRRAGILPSPPSPDGDPSLWELVEIARCLSPEERRNLRNYARWLLQQQSSDRM
jgi:transcriptional regulator with XRE-family HTH domain